MKKHLLVFFMALLLAACNLPQSAPALPTLPPASSLQPSKVPPTVLASQTVAPTDTLTVAPASPVPATLTLLPSDTPTITATATQPATPTQQYPTAVSKANTSCLYGPAKAYLYMYALLPGGTAAVQGRNFAANWLWVQPTNTQLLCWVSTSLVTVPVAIQSIPVVNPPLPTNPSVAPPTGVHATRSVSTVTIRWNPAAPALQLAYLIEASVCSKGLLLSVVVSTPGLFETLTDDKTCAEASSGQVRVQNKLGYSTAVTINWP
ncbi:MAG: hypothetical protein WCE68_11055 [Anaerolineales bacterium]